jgi:hypothetical protein
MQKKNWIADIDAFRGGKWHREETPKEKQHRTNGLLKNSNSFLKCNLDNKVAREMYNSGNLMMG